MLSSITLAVLYLGASAALAYLASRATLRREHRHGALRLLELCRRYLINYFRARDGSGALQKEVYVCELKVIVDRIDALLDAAYGRLAVQYPPISALIAELRRELVLAEASPALSLQNEPLQRVAGIYRAVKSRLPRRMRENDLDRDLERRIEETLNQLH